MTLFRKLFAFVVLSCGAALFGTAIYVYTYADPDPMPQVATIVVLSGPAHGETELLGETRERVDRGIALWRKGTAPRIVMTGGSPDDDHAPMADEMMKAALSAEVPGTVLLTEGKSHSTLQNAWFTAALPDIDPSEPIIVVTHRYHLPRAWASFRWAGFKDVTLVAADLGTPEITGMVLAEGLKWPLNIARAAAARVALIAGTAEADVLPWLE